MRTFGSHKMSHSRSGSASVPSDGEIVEPGPETKATASKFPLNGTKIDRPTRSSPSLAPRSPISFDGHRSPRRRNARANSPSRSRSRSPYRENRGYKRRYGGAHDDHESRRLQYDEPSQRYRSRYDERNQNQPPPSRRLKSYHDYDREEPYGEGLRYSDDYDRYQDERQRPGSHPSYREVRKPKQYSGDELDLDMDSQRPRPTEHVLSEREKVSTAPDPKRGTEIRESQMQKPSSYQAHVSDEEVTPNAEIIQESEPAEPVNEEDALEARRKRREAIRAKYRSQATPLHLKALNIGDSETDTSMSGTDPTNANEISDSLQASPHENPKESFPEFSIGGDTELANFGTHVNGSDQDEKSAVDYDPTVDMREEQEKHANVQIKKNDVSSAAYDELKSATRDVPLAAGRVAPVPEPDALDMFADDDMFAEQADFARPSQAPAAALLQTKGMGDGMLDEWDDTQGYYNIRLGELMDKRYQVQQTLGKGTFSNVVRAIDTQTGRLVAIKIIRRNDIMRAEALKEIDALDLLHKADPEGKKHIIKLDRRFEHKGHLCLVFENLSMNLRELLKKFGKNVGLNLRAIRAYSQQMFLGLSLLRQCNLIHADLKPDNILVNEQRSLLKICDLGSVFPLADVATTPTPYLASRFYRAPEVMLGIPYGFAIDTWAIGCTLYELFTGNILFTGQNNSQMLRAILECRGNYPPKLLRRGNLDIISVHFNENFTFIGQEISKISGSLEKRLMDFKKPTRDLKSRLVVQHTRGMSDVEVKELTLFVDFLDRCLALNPERRITPDEALKHPFLARRP